MFSADSIAPAAFAPPANETDLPVRPADIEFLCYNSPPWLFAELRAGEGEIWEVLDFYAFMPKGSFPF